MAIKKKKNAQNRPSRVSRLRKGVLRQGLGTKSTKSFQYLSGFEEGDDGIGWTLIPTGKGAAPHQNRVLGYSARLKKGAYLVRVVKPSVKSAKSAYIAKDRIEAAAPAPRANAILRGHQYGIDTLADHGGGFSSKQVIALLGGISERTLSRKIQADQLFYVTLGSSGRIFPATQFTDDGKPIAGLKDVLSALPTENGWARLQFLTSKNYDLDGETPIGVMLNGDVGRAKAAALMLN